MNKHLNIYQSYSKDERKFQLENDLTRALAISLQENSLFFHEVIKTILPEKIFNSFFEDLKNDTDINIGIQKSVENIGEFQHLYAVSLSEHIMETKAFHQQNNHSLYDPICDLVIRINDIVFIFEAKRDNIDCTSQLYNQAYNLLKQNGNEVDRITTEQPVTPIDLNWKKLMTIAVKVAGFERAVGTQNRFLSDFIELVRNHRFTWLPEVAIVSLASENKGAITRRIKNALAKSELKKIQEDRIGFYLPIKWSKEVIFSITANGGLSCSTYAGNTKEQGKNLFFISESPQFCNNIEILSENYKISKVFHIKFSSFQKYFAGLWFTDNDINEDIFTRQNFNTFSGRKKRDTWAGFENFFDRVFKPEFDWRTKCFWNSRMLNSNRNQFDVAFGYELFFEIPFEKLRSIDNNKEDLSPLTALLEEIYYKTPDLLIK